MREENGYSDSKIYASGEYLAYDDGSDRRYELVNGELVEMPAESDLNNAIAMYLIGVLIQISPVLLLRRSIRLPL